MYAVFHAATGHRWTLYRHVGLEACGVRLLLVLEAFTDSNVMIRNTAGQDIVAFLGVLEPRNWPECLEQLVTMLDMNDLGRQEVSGDRPSYVIPPASSRHRPLSTSSKRHAKITPERWTSKSTARARSTS